MSLKTHSAGTLAFNKGSSLHSCFSVCHSALGPGVHPTGKGCCPARITQFPWTYLCLERLRISQRNPKCSSCQHNMLWCCYPLCNPAELAAPTTAGHKQLGMQTGSSQRKAGTRAAVREPSRGWGGLVLLQVVARFPSLLGFCSA